MCVSDVMDEFEGIKRHSMSSVGCVVCVVRLWDTRMDVDGGSEEVEAVAEADFKKFLAFVAVNSTRFSPLLRCCSSSP